MLKYIKSIFTGEERPLQLTEKDLTGLRSGKVLSLDDEFGVSRDGIATIREMKNGKFRLLVNVNEVIGTYARRRDAVRGATRKGLTVND